MSGNQRQAFRFRFPANKQAGKLSLGDETIHVRLLDHSALGFSLLAPVHQMITSDSPLRLETTTATYEVRVIDVEEVNGEYRLGLALVHEIADSRKGKAALSTLSPTAHSAHRLRTTVLCLVCGVLLAAGVLLVSLSGLHPYSPSAVSVDGKSPSTVAKESTGAAEPLAGRNARTSKGNTVPRINAELQQRFDQLGAAVFMMPDVAKKLELTPQQIKNISRIVQKSAAAESQFASSGSDGKANLSRSRELLRQSRDEARNVLNADQAKQWDALIGSE